MTKTHSKKFASLEPRVGETLHIAKIERHVVNDIPSLRFKPQRGRHEILSHCVGAMKF